MKIVYKILRLYLLYFPRKKQSKRVTVGFIVLNDSASPRIVIKTYSNFFRFLNDSESCLNIVEATHIYGC